MATPGPAHDGVMGEPDLLGEGGGGDHGVAVAVDDRYRHVAGGEVLHDREPVAPQRARRHSGVVVGCHVGELGEGRSGRVTLM